VKNIIESLLQFLLSCMFR